MKNNLLLTVFACALTIGTNAQGRFTLSSGLAVTEGLNVGLRYGWNQYQVGFTAGTFPFTDVIVNPSEAETIFSASFYHHVYGTSRISDHKPWFYKPGISYVHAKEQDVVFRKMSLNLLIGKELNISSRFGLQICGGFFYMAYSAYEDDGEVYTYTEDDPIQPAGEISFFYHLSDRN